MAGVLKKNLRGKDLNFDLFQAYLRGDLHQQILQRFGLGKGGIEADPSLFDSTQQGEMSMGFEPETEIIDPLRIYLGFDDHLCG
jgi:hypothetical protein